MLAILEMILISLGYFYPTLLAFRYNSFIAMHKMPKSILGIKNLPTFQRACVLQCWAFFIQVINEVFYSHWIAGFIASLPSTALNLEVLIYLFRKFWEYALLSIKTIGAFWAPIFWTGVTNDFQAVLALNRIICDFGAFHAIEHVKNGFELLPILNLVDFDP